MSRSPKILPQTRYALYIYGKLLPLLFSLFYFMLPLIFRCESHPAALHTFVFFCFVFWSLLYIYIFFSSSHLLCLLIVSASHDGLLFRLPPHQQQSKWDIMWSRLIVRPEPRRRRQLGNAAYWLRSDCFAQIVFGNWSLAFCSGCRRITGWYKFMQAWSHICQYDILCDFCYLVSTVEHWNARGTLAESNPQVR